MNDLIIIAMICVGFYQAVTNIARVACFETASMPLKVRVLLGGVRHTVMRGRRACWPRRGWLTHPT